MRRGVLSQVVNLIMRKGYYIKQKQQKQLIFDKNKTNTMMQGSNNTTAILQESPYYHMAHLAKPYRSTTRKSQGLNNIAKTLNIFDKSNDQLSSALHNVQEQHYNDKGQKSRVTQFGRHSLKMYEMVGPISLRRKLLKDEQNTINGVNNSDMTDSNQNGKKTRLSLNKLKLQKLANSGYNDMKDSKGNMNASYEEMTNSAMNRMMSSTVNRNTIVGKRQKDEQNLFTKDDRTQNRYREYCGEWERQSSNIRKKSYSYSLNIKKPQSAINNYPLSSISVKFKDRKNELTLVQRAVKPVYIENNREREDIINNNVTRYWEMSLRNNHKELLQYMQGTKYTGVEFEEMLQTSNGMKLVERSIPTLKHRLSSQSGSSQADERLSLSGRRKMERQKDSVLANSDRDLLQEKEDQSRGSASIKKSNGLEQTTPHLSKGNCVHYQEEVYKINYDGRKHWLGTEGL